MTSNLDVVDWQAVASLLTFAAVAIALWEVTAQRREMKARSGHIVKSVGVMLIAFMMAFRAHLEETAPNQEIQLTTPLRELIDELFATFREAFIVVEPKRYGPMAKIVSGLVIIRTYDSFQREVGEDLLRQIHSYLTNTLDAVEVGPTIPRGWGE